jgi:hypothetical protein
MNKTDAVISNPILTSESILSETPSVVFVEICVRFPRMSMVQVGLRLDFSTNVKMTKTRSELSPLQYVGLSR